MGSARLALSCPCTASFATTAAQHSYKWRKRFKVYVHTHTLLIISMSLETFLISGNLCRCTGYRPILDGYKTFVCQGSQCSQGSQGSQCSQGSQGCATTSVRCCTAADGYSTASQLFNASTFADLDPTQELIFPAQLMV